MASHVSIIGCGQKYFFSKKSQLYFPSFLVKITHRNGQDKEQHEYHFRNKKDFLVLKRSKSLTESSIGKSFPKSIFKKLNDAAEKKPWIRPESYSQEQEVQDVEAKIGYSVDESLKAFHPSMKKSVLILEDFVNSYKDYDGWEEFCRSGDGDNIVDRNKKNDVTMTTESSDISRSAKLGQYFAHMDNANKLLDEVVTFVKSLSNPNGILFVEPSCGDGQIVMNLINHISKLKEKIATTILAYDIDEAIIEKCKSNISRMENLEDVTIDLHINISCRNFLNLDREQMMMDALLANDANCTTIFLGGPPYTSGIGDGESMDRDLPSAFIHHCIQLKADFISFILPDRYERHENVEVINKQINQRFGEIWRCKSHQLTTNKFSFKEMEISQPSIIQSWSKTLDNIE